MSITQTQTASFKTELLEAIHDFTTDTFKIALYLSSATLNIDTTAYTSTGESSGSGYTAGGQTLATNTVVPATSTTAAYAYWTADPLWTPVTVTAAGALIYNSSKANRSVAVLTFGATYASAPGGSFEVVMPAATPQTGLVRVA